MDEANLATVFAPNLMHSGRQEERPLVSVDEQTLRLQARVVRTLIEYADSIGTYLMMAPNTLHTL